MLTEYYPRRLIDLPMKKSKDQHTHKNQDLIIKLLHPMNYVLVYELCVGLVDLIENLPDSMIGYIFRNNFATGLCFLPN